MGIWDIFVWKGRGFLGFIHAGLAGLGLLYGFGIASHGSTPWPL